MSSKNLILFSFLWPLTFFGQEFNVQGIILDANGGEVPFANVVLLSPVDSTVVKGTSSEDDGTFFIAKISPGSYILDISYLGYANLSTAINVQSDLDTGPHFLSELTENLDEVNIVVQRPTITRQPDRLRFNVANTALIEGNMLQVIKNTPSLFVIDGSILIKNSIAEVYINNRKVRLSPSELLQFLESAPANSIKSVEVIDNPPASYDASSGAVVNIIMDKNMVTGYRGSVATQYKQGRFPNYNFSTNHFFRGTKSGFNLSYAYKSDKINRLNDDVVNYLDNSNNLSEKWTSDINRITNTETHNLNLSYDYSFDESNSLVLSSNTLYLPYFRYRIDNTTEITDMRGDFLSSFNANNLSRDDMYNINGDLTFTHRLKNDGKLEFNTHYTSYDYNRFQVVNSVFFNSDRVQENASLFNTDNNQKTDIFSLRGDYSIAMNESSKLDAGIKFGIIDTESDITRIDIVNGQEDINEAGTNDFDYNEKIFAAYLNYNKDWENWNVILGLRVENTDIEGFSRLDNQTNQQDYLKLFPNASVQFKVSDKLNLRSNYKRSITRPDYFNLNPFQFFLNENTIVTGNPGLQPITTDHVVMGLDFTDNFTFETYLTLADGQIYELPLQNNDTNIITYTPINIDRSIEYGFDFAYQTSILDNWYLSALTSFYHHEDSNIFGNQEIDIERWSNYSALTNVISLLKDNSLNVNLTFRYGSKYIYNLANVEGRLFSDISVSKTVLDGKGVLSLNASDFFNTSDTRLVTKYLNQSSVYSSDDDNRYVSFGFRYKFGNTKLKTNERTISTDETDRLKEED